MVYRNVMLVFCRRFCNDERSGIKSSHPDYTVGDIAKELGKKWGEVDETTKSKYEAMAEKDKARYERVCHFPSRKYPKIPKH